ncbi:MAG: TSUP family transporter, partial [Gemmatimonadota bacterium]
MTLAGWLAALAVGLLAGGMSGLLGIGGGVVMVPFLYLLLAHPEWSGIAAAPGREAVLAHATSLFVIIPTSLRGAWLYHR